MKLAIEVHAEEKTGTGDGRNEQKEEQAIDLLRPFPCPFHLAREDDDGRQASEEEHEVAGVYERGLR